MHSIKIIGAGSIGNHIAYAARSKGWSVVLTDNDPAALERARTNIYPGRYGKWDESISLQASAEAANRAADVVFIGTPPDSHFALARQVLEASNPPRVLVIEKPLTGPDLEGCEWLAQRAARAGTFIAVGYNHTLGRNTVVAEEQLAKQRFGHVQTISARTREHWGGILKAHPWLSGPGDSYLGSYRRGGGATGEHSHGINMWQHFAGLVGAGRVVEVSATLDIVKIGSTEYDRAAFITLKTESGLIGDVIQDVVTSPPDKSLRLQFERGFLEWRVNAQPNVDSVTCDVEGAEPNTISITKTRADDFRLEIEHIAGLLDGSVKQSPIALERGLDTMLVIAAAFKSQAAGRRVTIRRDSGYGLAALS